MHLLLLLLKLGERRPKNWRKIHGLLISVQTKVEDVDKIFDRVGICVTRETGEIIHIDFLTDTTFTYIGSCFVEKVGVWDF